MSERLLPEAGAELTQEALVAVVERVQKAAEDGQARSRVRMQLVQEGLDADAADAIVDRVFKPELPLSQRHRASAAMAASSASSAGSAGSVGGGGVQSWMFWLGGLALINFLSWAFDWSFWIY